MSDELIKGKEELKTFSRFMLFQVTIIGVLWAADTTFFFFEQNFLDTYLSHVLGLTDLHISLMVALSAAMGLITNFLWGIISDNTRSKYGRRRPFLLFSILAGMGMIFFALSRNYILCVLFDVLLIGITSNAVSVSSRAIIPDVVDSQRRGRANGIVQAVSYVGLIIALIMFLLSNELWGVSNPSNPTETIITFEGHLILLTFGGIFYAVCGVIGFFLLKEKSKEELPPRKSMLTELKELVNPDLLKEQTNFFKVVLAATIFQTGVGCVMPFLFNFIFELGLTTTKLLIAVGLGFLVLFPLVLVLGRLADEFGRKRFLPLIIIIIAIGFFLVPLVKGTTVNFLLFIVLVPFILLGLLGLVTIINTWAQDTLPEGKKGQFYGIFNITLTVSQIIGSFAGGAVSVAFGRQFIFLIGAVFFVASIPLFAIVKETLEME